MSTYSLSGTGTQALSANTTALHVTITTTPAQAGLGKANPNSYYDIALLRYGDGTGWWDPIPVHGGPQWIGLPNGTTQLGYACLNGAVISVVEVIGGTSPFVGPAGSTGATGATGPAGPTGSVATASCRAFNSANISTTSSADKTLTFDSERFDTDTIHSTSSNTSRLTCHTAGKYAIFGNITFAGNVTGQRSISVVLNGTTVIAQMQMNAPIGGAAGDMAISTLWSMAVNDYVELVVNQNSGGALNVLFLSGGRSPEFGMSLVNP